MAKLKKRGDVEGLRSATGYRNFVVDRGGQAVDLGSPTRLEALEALVELAEEHPDEVVEGLAAVVHDPDEEVRETAVTALAARREPAAGRALVDAATAFPEGDRAGEAAREALLDGGHSGTIEYLAEALLARPQADANLLAAAIEAQPRSGYEERQVVARLAGVLAGSSAPAARRRAGDLLAPLDGGPVDSLLAVLPRAVQPAEVALALGQTEDRRAGSALVALLESGEVVVRRAAATALGQLHDPNVVEALLAAARDSDTGVRRAATEAVNNLGVVGMVAGMEARMRAQQRQQPLPPEPPTIPVKPPEESRALAPAADEGANGQQRPQVGRRRKGVLRGLLGG